MNKEKDELAPVIQLKKQESNVVQPGPLPTSVTIGQADFGDRKMVMLAISTPAGQGIYFLDGNSAEGVAQALLKIGTATKAGLVIP